MVRYLVSLGLCALVLGWAAGPGVASPLIPATPDSAMEVGERTITVEPVHYRSRSYGPHKHRRAGEPFILRRPEYGQLLYSYDRRASYPYRCVPRTAAQFHYCRERYITFDPATGSWVTYLPYVHLCTCR